MAPARGPYGPYWLPPPFPTSRPSPSGQPSPRTARPMEDLNQLALDDFRQTSRQLDRSSSQPAATARETPATSRQREASCGNAGGNSRQRDSSCSGGGATSRQRDASCNTGRAPSRQRESSRSTSSPGHALSRTAEGGEQASPLGRKVKDVPGKAKEDRNAKLTRDDPKRQDETSHNKRGHLQRSMSNPDSIQKPELSDEEKRELGLGWKPKTMVDRPGVNSRFYPHPSHLRGMKQLTKMGMLGRGVDPIKDKAHRDLLWEAPLDRFERNQKLHGALVGGSQDGGMRTPRHTDQWRTQEAVANRGVYEKPWKVNHVWPVRTENGGVGSDIRHRAPGEAFDAKRQRG